MHIEIGSMVRGKSDDGSMGFAEVIGFHEGHAWVLYRDARCYRSHELTNLEAVPEPHGERQKPTE